VSHAERPELKGLSDLEEVAHLIAEELAAFRIRAQKAEAARAELGTGGLGASGEYDVVEARSRIVQLEAENRDLQARVEEARERVNDLLTRLQFLEEQMTSPGGAHR
jgi:predicted nuclease with TOPRIM domain